jgi:hypothetical protein
VRGVVAGGTVVERAIVGRRLFHTPVRDGVVYHLDWGDLCFGMFAPALVLSEPPCLSNLL